MRGRPPESTTGRDYGAEAKRETDATLEEAVRRLRKAVADGALGRADREVKMQLRAYEAEIVKRERRRKTG